MIYIIIVNYNNSKDTIECIESLNLVITKFKAIIIDNCSNDENYKVLASYIGPEKTIVKNRKNVEDLNLFSQHNILLYKVEKNLGFAGGNNLGINIARNQMDFEGVVLLNNDTVVDPFFLDEILNCKLKNKNAELIGGRIFLYDNKVTIWYDGGKLIKTLNLATHKNQNKKLFEINTKQEPQPTDFITGCLLYISKDCLDRIGLLNEDFFMYCEDLEYCIRAKKNGLSLFHVPTSIIWHKVGASSGGDISSFAAYWGIRNRIKVTLIHSNFFQKVITFGFIFITRLPKFIFWKFKGRPDIINAQVKGILDGFINNKY